ncbi:conserved hypothetical protein [Ricinus communis]|uniref:Uncharacterized protein n=1 Tax=Ricinus communis TaxID=3988 RepID=B9REZ7_RICCO|nr:conserved hypothetical protein [Ricinus communis]
MEEREGVCSTYGNTAHFKMFYMEFMHPTKCLQMPGKTDMEFQTPFLKLLKAN